MPDLIEQIKAHPDMQPEVVFAEFAMPPGKNSHTFRSPFRDDGKHGSFTIYMDTGRWKDFGGAGESGDVIDFLAKKAGRMGDKSYIGDLARELGLNGSHTESTEFGLRELADQKSLTVESLAMIHATPIRKEHDYPEEICIPMFDFFGKMTGFRRRFRTGKPKTNKNGKLGLMVPRSIDFGGVFNKRSPELWFPEGETDLAAAVMMGLGRKCLARPGATACNDIVVSLCKRAGCEAVVLGDNDLLKGTQDTSPGKIGAEKLAMELVKAGIKVKVWIPPEKGQDLRDWMIAGGTGKGLEELVAATPYFEDDGVYKPLCGAAKANNREPFSNELASDFFEQEGYMRHWRDEFYTWTGTQYRVLKYGEVLSKAWTFATPHLWRGGPTSSKVGNMMTDMKATSELPDLEMPMWLEPGDLRKAEPAKPGNYIPMANGLFDVKANKLLSPDPSYFSLGMLPIEFDKDAECPQWDKFLLEIFEEDLDKIQIIQQFFGYCLIPGQNFQKFLLMHGDGDNGKSQLLDVLTEFLGDNNVSNLGLDRFGAEYALWGVIGKLANIGGDVPELNKVAEGYLKLYTGGDAMMINRKHISAVNQRLGAKLVMSCNSLPRFTDKSDGIWRRMLLIFFNFKIDQKKKVPNLGKKIAAAELPGIFNWALAGMRFLISNNGFVESAASMEGVRQYRLDYNPQEVFVDEMMVLDPGSTISKMTAYKEYSNWCIENGSKPLNNTHFGRVVFKMYPHIKIGKVAEGDRFSRVNSYIGIRMRQFSDDD